MNVKLVLKLRWSDSLYLLLLLCETKVIDGKTAAAWDWMLLRSILQYHNLREGGYFSLSTKGMEYLFSVTK